MDHVQNYLELKGMIESLERRVSFLEDSSPSIPQAGVNLNPEDLRDPEPAKVDMVGFAKSVFCGAPKG